MGLERGRATQLHLRPAGISAPLNLDAGTRTSAAAPREVLAPVTQGSFAPAANSRSSAGRVITGDMVQVFLLCLGHRPAVCEREADWGAEDWLPPRVLVALVTLRPPHVSAHTTAPVRAGPRPSRPSNQDEDVLSVHVTPIPWLTRPSECTYALMCTQVKFNTRVRGWQEHLTLDIWTCHFSCVLL